MRGQNNGPSVLIAGVESRSKGGTVGVQGSHRADRRATEHAGPAGGAGNRLGRQVGCDEAAGGRPAPLGGHGRGPDAPESRPGGRRRDFRLQPGTVSRRRDLLRPVTGKVLARFIPDPVTVLGREGTALADGTVCPAWDWNAIPDLFSGKAGYAGMNVEVAASLDGEVAAIGPVPVHGARHDAHAYDASGLKALLEHVSNKAADLGYIGVEGIDIVPFKRASGHDLCQWQGEFNAQLSKIRLVRLAGW